MRSRKVLAGIYSVGVTGVAAVVVSMIIYLNEQSMTGFLIPVPDSSTGESLPCVRNLSCLNVAGTTATILLNIGRSFSMKLRIL